MNAIIENPDVEQETCAHEEWMWEEGDRYCLICGKNLTSGINWSQTADLERRYEEEHDALADSYVPEDEEAADDTASSLVSLEESAKCWAAPADYTSISFSFE